MKRLFYPLFLTLMLSGFIHSARLFADSNTWTTLVKTDEFSHRFGGPLLAEEKPLVGMWSGRNDSNDTWEIIRRPNHTYSIQVKWIEEGKRESFRGHGLWAVQKEKFLYVDLLDEDLKYQEEWPLEIMKMIPHEELSISKEILKSASSKKVVTSEEEVGDCIELKVEKFKGTWMQSFNKTDLQRDGQLYDQIQLARVGNVGDLVDFFMDRSHRLDPKFVGQWRSQDNDPDGQTVIESIRRVDGSHSNVILKIFGEEEEEPFLTHGLWTVSNGKFYECDLYSEEEAFDFESIFFYGDEITNIGKQEFVTQWVDQERKILKFLPLVITIKNKRIENFSSDLMQKELKKRSIELKDLLQSARQPLEK